MTSRIERFLISIMFALLAAGVTLIIASAQGTTPASGQADTNSSDCAVCHTEFEMTWENGPHGKAGSDPIFLDAWATQGKPGACLVCHTTGYDPATATYKADGVTCEACHGPAPADHPKTPMPIDRSTDLCGRCHSDTRHWSQTAHAARGSGEWWGFRAWPLRASGRRGRSAPYSPSNPSTKPGSQGFRPGLIRSAR